MIFRNSVCLEMTFELIGGGPTGAVIAYTLGRVASLRAEEDFRLIAVRIIAIYS